MDLHVRNKGSQERMRFSRGILQAEKGKDHEMASEDYLKGMGKKSRLAGCRACNFPNVDKIYLNLVLGNNIHFPVLAIHTMWRIFLKSSCPFPIEHKHITLRCLWTFHNAFCSRTQDNF